MFQKVLVAEDMSSINEGVTAILKNEGVSIIDYAQYCDDAFVKLKRAQKDNDPYQLLISDMSFKKDYRDDKIANGEALISLAKQHQPDIKIVAYSIEDKVNKVKRLFESYDIDGYVCKDRRGLIELMTAVKSAFNNEKFASPVVSAALTNGDVITDFTEYDVALLKLLASGIKQTDLSKQLQSKHISPNSTSHIEKRLNILKTMFGANNSIHLIALTKDLGLI